MRGDLGQTAEEGGLGVKVGGMLRGEAVEGAPPQVLEDEEQLPGPPQRPPEEGHHIGVPQG